MVCILKKNGKLRTVFNLCMQNRNTEKDVSPFPDQDTIRHDVTRATYRSKLDMYEQIRVRDEDVPKTAFATIFSTFVMSSSSYLNSSEVKVGSLEVRRFPGIGFSSCTAPTYSCIQDSRVFQMEVTNQVSGMRQNGEVYQNDSESEGEGERSGGSEFV